MTETSPRPVVRSGEPLPIKRSGEPLPIKRSGVDPLPVDPDGLRCSAKDCRTLAAYDLQWNNPKIHTADRRKHWLACADHRDSLSAFLTARGFLRDVAEL